MDRDLSFSTFTLDANEACLWRDGSRLDLSPKDFALLHYLVAHRGRTIPHAELLHAVWNGTSVGPEVLKVRIGRLRRLLGDDATSPRFIKNVHGEGYRFLSPPLTPLLAPEAPLVGRDAPLAQLEGLLFAAASGSRQIVFVTGEPGIGKTALIDLFAERAVHLRGPAAGASRVWIGRGQCIEHYGSGESYLPVMEALGRLARDHEGERLEAVLERHAPSWLLEMPALLSGAEREALQRQFLGPAPGRMVRELAEAVEALTADGEGGEAPVLVLVIEDLQWADPSTLDLLAALAHRRDRARLIVIGSYRPLELSSTDHPLRRLLQELRSGDPITELALAPLNEADLALYLEARFAAAELPPQLAPMLHRRTEGNPLFFTDVLRDLLSRHVMEHTEGRWLFRGDIADVDSMVPASIRQLMTRLRERLPAEDQRLLEAASIEGLQFSANAVAAALERQAAEIEEQCLRLAEQRQFVRLAGAQEWPDGTPVSRFAFLHAVHRELWQERVGAKRLQEWHLRIGERKEAAYCERTGEIAVELALHFEKGGDPLRAIAYLEQASRQALQRAAPREAEVLLQRAFALLDKVVDARQRLQPELRLQLGLGTVRAMSEGYGAGGTAGPYRRAHDLCRQIGETPDIFHPVFGLCRYLWMKGELYAARELGAQLLRIAERDSDPLLRIAAHCAFGNVALNRGELQEARSHLETGLALSADHWNESYIPVFGNDLESVCRGSLAVTLQLLGYPDQAAVHRQVLAARMRLDPHPMIESSSTWGAGIYHQCRGEWAQLSHCADELSRLASRYEYPDFALRAEIFRGWASIAGGDPAQGMVQIRRAIESLQATGARLCEPFARAALAQSYRATGRTAEARHEIADTLAASSESGEQWYDAELLRIDAEVLAESRPAGDETEARFRQAIDTARGQSARSWELRAALGLAALWRRRGDASRAHDLVAETYAGFTEGFGTIDLQRAREVLERGGNEVGR